MSLRARLTTDPSGVFREASQLAATEERPSSDLCDVLAWACYELCDIAAAVEWLERAEQSLAVESATEEPSIDRRFALAQLAATVRSAEGRPERALDVLDSIRLGAAAEPAEEIQLQLLLGMVSGQCGLTEKALEHYRIGLELAEAAGDHGRQIRLLNNRGVCHLENGDLVQAQADFATGEQLAGDNDPISVAVAQHNQGVLASRRGNMGHALRLFTAADKHFGPADAVWAHGPALLDRALLLKSAGLYPEALQAATSARLILEESGAAAQAVFARQMESLIHAARSEWTDALTAAADAVTMTQNANLATRIHDRGIALQLLLRHLTAISQAETAPGPITALESTAFEDFPELGLDLALLLAEHGQRKGAAAVLAALPETMSPTAGLHRLHTGIAAVLAAAVEGRAEDVLTRTLQEMESLQQETLLLSSTDFRGVAHRRLMQLRDVGIEAGLQGKDRAAVVDLVLAERSIALAPEPDLSADEQSTVARLRSVEAALSQQPLGERRTAELLSSRRDIEAHLRQLRRFAEPTPADRRINDPKNSPTAGTLYMIRSRSRIVFMWVQPDGTTDALGEVASQQFGRVARATQVAAQVCTAANSDRLLRRSLQSLQTMVQPILDRMNQTAPTVTEQIRIVRDRSIPPVPWSLLTLVPTVQVVPVDAPESRPPTSSLTGGPVLVSGPGLDHADREIAAIADLYPSAVTLTGTAASAEALMTHFSTSDFLHIAAHGNFRDDNPLASTLGLADGPVTFFDLLAQKRAPSRIILSACGVGRAAGATPVGLASILFGRGCQALVASNGFVPDDTTAVASIAIHRHLIDGLPLPVALRRAQEPTLANAPALSLMTALRPW